MSIFSKSILLVATFAATSAQAAVLGDEFYMNYWGTVTSFSASTDNRQTYQPVTLTNPNIAGTTRFYNAGPNFSGIASSTYQVGFDGRNYGWSIPLNSKYYFNSPSAQSLYSGSEIGVFQSAPGTANCGITGYGSFSFLTPVSTQAAATPSGLAQVGNLERLSVTMGDALICSAWQARFDIQADLIPSSLLNQAFADPSSARDKLGNLLNRNNFSFVGLDVPATGTLFLSFLDQSSGNAFEAEIAVNRVAFSAIYQPPTVGGGSVPIAPTAILILMGLGLFASSRPMRAK
jgi:hypothetical protein